MNEEVKEVQALEKYSPSGLIAQALSQNVPIETLEKLMGLQERWQAGQAKAAFLEAFGKFQNLIPVIVKDKQVAFGATRYKYASIASIIASIKDAIAQTGLSYRWELQDKGDDIICTCIVSHIDGHSEKTTMAAKRDTSGSKSDIQSRGSAVTYLQRYTLIGALGISTADEDVDGRREPLTPEIYDPLGNK